MNGNNEHGQRLAGMVGWMDGFGGGMIRRMDGYTRQTVSARRGW